MAFKAWPPFPKKNAAFHPSLICSIVLGTLLYYDGVRAEPPPSSPKTTQTEKSAGLASGVDIQKLADLQSRLDKKEIRAEEYIALKEQWIKDRPPSPPAKKPNPSAAPVTNISKEQTNPAAAALIEIRKSAQSPEEKIRQVDVLVTTHSHLRPTQPPLPPTVVKPNPGTESSDAKATRQILSDANKLAPEARVARIDQEAPTLEKSRRALPQDKGPVPAPNLNTAPTVTPLNP